MQSSLVICLMSALVATVVAAPSEMRISDIPMGSPGQDRELGDPAPRETENEQKVLNKVEKSVVPKDAERTVQSLRPVKIEANHDKLLVKLSKKLPVQVETPEDREVGDSAANDQTVDGLGLVQSPGQRASGQAHSVAASSAAECATLCAKHDSCDAVNFHKPSRKCRFFHRCVPYTLHADSNDYVHFSKRPAVREKGWAYDVGSDTCLRAMGPASGQAVGAKKCAASGGRLAALTGPELNKLAAKLLRNAAAQYAWIGLKDSLTEGNPIHINGEKVSTTGFFPRAPQQHRNDSKRNCWSISDAGEWAEHSCKNRRQFSICQIVPYSV